MKNQMEKLKYGKPTGRMIDDVGQAISQLCDDSAYREGQIEKMEQRFEKLVNIVGSLTEMLHEKGVLSDVDLNQLLDNEYRVTKGL